MRSFRSTAALVSAAAALAGVCRRRLGATLLRRFASARRRGFAAGRARTVVLAAEAARCRRTVPTVAGCVTTSGASAAPPSGGDTGCGSLLVPETAAAARKPQAIRPMPSSTALSRLKARVEPGRTSAPPARCAAASSPSVRFGPGLGRSAGTARTRVAKSGSTSTSSGLIGSITSCPSEGTGDAGVRPPATLVSGHSRWDAEDPADGLGCPQADSSHGRHVRSRLLERGGSLRAMNFQSHGPPLVGHFVHCSARISSSLRASDR